MYFLENAFFLYLYFQGPEIFMQHQGLHKKGYIKIPWGLHKMGLHKHFDIFGGLHKKSGLGVTPKKKNLCSYLAIDDNLGGVVPRTSLSKINF